MRDDSTVALNRKARHEFTIDETFEAGLALTGTEIKSIRAGKANIANAYARIEKGEAWLIGADIAPFEQGNRYNHDPKRTRKLLLHRRRDRRAARPRQGQGPDDRAAAPLHHAAGKAKIELGLARGKQLHDRRRDIADRDAKRDIARQLRGHPARPLDPRPRRRSGDGSTRERPSSPPRAILLIPNRCSVLWGCVVSTGPGCQGTRAEVPSGLVKQAAKRSTWQPPVDSRPRCLGSKVSVEATSASRVVEASFSEAAIRMSVT